MPENPGGSAPASNGITSIPSHHTVDETVSRLTAALEAKNIHLFALIDHSGEAAKAGLTMPPTKLLIFGNPRAGTSLMLASPSIALDLPLKILIWQDSQDKIWLSWNTPDFLAQRHHLPADLLPVLAAAATLATQAAQ